MKIDILVGKNPYDTVYHFSDALAHALRENAVSVRLFLLSEENFFDVTAVILQDPPDCSCSFSDITIGGRSLNEHWPIPHHTFFIDPPIYFLHHLNTTKSSVSCVDQKDCAFVRSLNFNQLFFSRTLQINDCSLKKTLTGPLRQFFLEVALIMKRSLIVGIKKKKICCLRRQN